MSNLNIKNKKAWFEYEIIERIVTGIELTGTEIKSIRAGKASLAEAYCKIIESEMFIIGMNISEYTHGTYNNHEPRRQRKLLLERRDINRFESKVNVKGLAIVPLRLFINENGWAKLEIALAKGKKTFDKRETLKQSDAKREMDRNAKY